MRNINELINIQNVKKKRLVQSNSKIVIQLGALRHKVYHGYKSFILLDAGAIKEPIIENKKATVFPPTLNNNEQLQKKGLNSGNIYSEAQKYKR
jgi:hypothetical protein